MQGIFNFFTSTKIWTILQKESATLNKRESTEDHWKKVLKILKESHKLARIHGISDFGGFLASFAVFAYQPRWQQKLWTRLYYSACLSDFQI